MAIGPVEYLVIAFPGNQFNGDIAPAIADLVESGTVRIIDLAFVKKDPDGTVTAFEYDELPEIGGLADVEGDAGGLFNDEDLMAFGDALEPNNSAALLVWEDLWAAPLAVAIRESGGQIIAGERVPREAVEEIMEMIEEATD